MVYIFFSTGQVLLSTPAGVLDPLMCLKLYSWYSWGERCTPHPPTPPPSCSLQGQILMGVFSWRKGWQDSGMRQPGRLWSSHNWAHYPTACSSMGKTEIPPSWGCHPGSHVILFPRNCFIPISYSATSLDSLINSNNFLVEFTIFYVLDHVTSRDYFTFFFSVGCLFLP